MPPLAPEPDIATPEPPPLVSSRPPEPIPAASRAAPAWGTGLAWAASLLLLAAAAGAAWYWRVSLVEAWPPAARAFMALGLAG
jgi:fatty acid desaturase